MNMPTVVKQSPQAGTFPDLSSADRAVEQLLTAGFSPEQIAVLCTDEAIGDHFLQLGYERPADLHTPGEEAAVTSIGAAVGGVAAIAVGAASGAVPLIIAGVAGIAGGSALGGFLGTMLNGEGENEFVRYYDQEIRHGRILVVADDQNPQADSKRAQAAVILARSATDPE